MKLPTLRILMLLLYPVSTSKTIESYHPEL